MIACESFYIDWIKSEDAKSLSVLMNNNSKDFEAYFPLTLAANKNEKKAAIFIARILEDIKHKKQFLFTLKIDNNVIGLVYLKELDWHKKEGEFAYCIDARYGGKGYMSQAIKAIVAFAFSTYDLVILKIIAHKTNLASVKVAQNNGFQFIETLKNAYTPPNGQPLDMELYQLMKSSFNKSVI